VIISHKIHHPAAPNMRMHDDHIGFSFAGLRLYSIENAYNHGMILFPSISVTSQPKASNLAFQVPRGITLSDRAVDLFSVISTHGNEVIDFPGRSEHEKLPQF